MAGSVLAGTSAAQTTIEVPGDEPTVADGLAAADSGDTVAVASGSFSEPALVIGQDDLTLRGVGSGETTIESQSGGRGITVEGDGVTLEGFTLDGAGGYGLKLQFASDLSLRDVHATNNGRTGIDLNKTDDPTLTDVVSRNNDGGMGIALRDLEGATIENARTGSNGWGGLALWAPSGESLLGTSVTGSTFENEQVAGVVVQYAGPFDASFEGNRIRDNGIGVHVDDAFGEVEGIDGISIRNNDIESNEIGVLNAESNDELDAAGNWWGHASGPGGSDGRTNPAGRVVGKGDSIAGDVDFDDWLRRPIDHPSR
ncbi:right-handed parallel beta-helix repeat-containing protein [Halorubrum sp. DTA98]|uniref:right-handed parallel beta-helix repeat-containing protein n=1 Tax=Halorubrum sp. DTA98 TaxID=3402163 RepID=UPI003AAAFD16